MWQLLKGFMLATAVIFCGEVMVLAAARLNYHDPFIDKAELMPGQPIETIRGYLCQPPFDMNTQVEAVFCTFEVSNDILNEVIGVNANQQITATFFIFEANTFFLGDLVWCWGQPIHTIDNSKAEIPTLDVYWDNQVHAYLTPQQSSSKMDYFLPVTTVSIERQWRNVDYDKVRCAFGR